MHEPSKKKNNNKKKGHEVFRKRAERLPFLRADSSSRSVASAEEFSSMSRVPSLASLCSTESTIMEDTDTDLHRRDRTLSMEKAEELDMDHIYVSFLDFLWAHTFIGPFSYLLWKTNLTWFMIRKYLVRIGILEVKPVDLRELVGKLCLEQSQVINYYACTKGSTKIAGLFFADFPYIDNDCKYQVADLFVVDIDLSTKKMVKARLDDKDITPSKALILLWFNTIGAQHVKLHALANWGVNTDPSLKDTNPFFYRNSLVTTIYNYFGFTCFSTFMEEWERPMEAWNNL